jgi:hypothetical protein
LALAFRTIGQALRFGALFLVAASGSVAVGFVTLGCATLGFVAVGEAGTGRAVLVCGLTGCGLLASVLIDSVVAGCGALDCVVLACVVLDCGLLGVAFVRVSCLAVVLLAVVLADVVVPGVALLVLGFAGWGAAGGGLTGEGWLSAGMAVTLVVVVATALGRGSSKAICLNSSMVIRGSLSTCELACGVASLGPPRLATGTALGFGAGLAAWAIALAAGCDVRAGFESTLITGARRGGTVRVGFALATEADGGEPAALAERQ